MFPGEYAHNSKQPFTMSKLFVFSSPGLGHQLPVATGRFVAMNMAE